MNAFALLLAASLLLPALGARAEEAGSGREFTDPFAYCASVGTVDRPDARWDGAALPPEVADGLVRIGLLAASAPEAARHNAVWRCMDGNLWVCAFGANLPCTETADTSRTPSSATADYCRENPDSDFVPAFVTGRATVYAWRCRGGAAEIERQLETPDARGFQSGIWHVLPKPD